MPLPSLSLPLAELVRFRSHRHDLTGPEGEDIRIEEQESRIREAILSEDEPAAAKDVLDRLHGRIPHAWPEDVADQALLAIRRGIVLDWQDAQVEDEDGQPMRVSRGAVLSFAEACMRHGRVELLRAVVHGGIPATQRRGRLGEGPVTTPAAWAEVLASKDPGYAWHADRTPRSRQYVKVPLLLLAAAPGVKNRPMFYGLALDLGAARPHQLKHEIGAVRNVGGVASTDLVDVLLRRELAARA